MPNYTPRLNLPKPLGSENNTRANFNALIDAIDSAAETPAGAQAKADAVEQAAKTYTDTEVGNRATKTEFDNHANATTGVHGATSNATPNRIPIRDADGNFFVNPPKDGWHVARKAEIDSHASENLAHNATPSPFANRIMSRDGNGRSAIADPTADSHIANKRYVDAATADVAKKDGTLQTNLNAEMLSGMTATAVNTPNTIMRRDTQGRTGVGRIDTTNVTINSAGNRTLWFVDENGNNKGLLFHNEPTDSMVLRIYGSTSSSYRELALNFNNGLTYQSQDVVLANGNYANLRARGTTKADVGLGNVTNDAQLKIASNLSDVANVSTARSNLGLTGNSNTTHYHDSRYYTKSEIDSELNSVKQSVGNGKTAIRDAIIDAGGTAPTGSPDSYTHQDLANAISTVSKYASGSTPSQTTVQIRGINFDVGAFSFFYQTSDSGGVSVMFSDPYAPFIRKTSTTASDPTITPVSGGFDITLDRPAGTDLTWEAWGS